jgi:predicted nucleic acid-binding protein
MRLDGVEVKVSLDSDQTAEAVRALDLADVRPWRIFFVEDVTTGLCSGTPLLDQHLVVRARQKTKGKDDVTVKFRPGRRSQLTDSWLATTRTADGNLDAELKVEEDWAGERRVLSISLTAERPNDLVAAAAAGERGIGALLTHDQRRLVDECAGTFVNLTALTMLPAVSAMRWPTFTVPGPAGPALDVRAERWTVQDLDFLELSIAVEVQAAQAAQAALLAFVEGKGLQPSGGEAKTTQVLQRLVTQVAC